MLLTVFLLVYPGIIDPPTIYDGRRGNLAVRVSRMEVEPVGFSEGWRMISPSNGASLRTLARTGNGTRVIGELR